MTRSSETYATFRNRLKLHCSRWATTLNTVAPSLRPWFACDWHFWARYMLYIRLNKILEGHVEEILLFNIFPIVDTCLNCKDIARQSCAMVRRRHIFGDFLTTVLNEQLFVQPVIKPGCDTVWQPAVYTIKPFVKPVVKPVWQPVVSCKRGLTVYSLLRSSVESIREWNHLMRSSMRCWEFTVSNERRCIIYSSPRLQAAEYMYRNYRRM